MKTKKSITSTDLPKTEFARAGGSIAHGISSAPVDRRDEVSSANNRQAKYFEEARRHRNCGYKAWLLVRRLSRSFDFE